MKKKSINILIFAVLLVVITLSTSIKVDAANITGKRYETYLTIPDNTLNQGPTRMFYKGKFTWDITFDAWNSKICKNSSATSKLLINLQDYASLRIVAVKEIGTRLYICSRVDFGTFKQRDYRYFSSTFSSNQQIYCGFKSNSIVMQST